MRDKASNYPKELETGIILLIGAGWCYWRTWASRRIGKPEACHKSLVMYHVLILPSPRPPPPPPLTLPLPRVAVVLWVLRELTALRDCLYVSLHHHLVFLKRKV